MDRAFPRLVLLAVLAIAAVGVGHQSGLSADTAVDRWDEGPPIAGDAGLTAEFPVWSHTDLGWTPVTENGRVSGRAGIHGASESRAGTSQRSVTVDEPSGVYVLGGRETVRGTAPSDVEAVAVYVRGTGDWQLVDLDGDEARSDGDSVAVESGRWESPEVTLSNASDLLTAPGAYELGVIAVTDAVEENGTLRSTLSPGAFSAGQSARTVIVARPAVASEPLVFEDVADQVAVEDGVVTVRGVATGSEEVLVFVVDGRGQLASETVSVGDDDVFESEFELAQADGDPLAEGFAVGQVLQVGRDGRVGDGEIRGEPAPGLTDLQSYLRDRIERARERGSPLTQAQLLRVVEAETVGDTASDDLRVVDTFRLTEALTTIDAVVPANATDGTGETDSGQVTVGEQIAVRGQTNRRPSDTTLFVDLLDPTTGRVVAATETDAWGLSGDWRVTLSTAGIDPGNYTVRVDDGDDRDAVPVQVLPASQNVASSASATRPAVSRSRSTSSVNTSTATVPSKSPRYSERRP